MKMNRKNDYYIKYRKSNLTQLSATIPKDKAEAIKNELKRDKLSFRKFILNAIDEYLNKKVVK